jgi:hypothetical protein
LKRLRLQQQARSGLVTPPRKEAKSLTNFPA